MKTCVCIILSAVKNQNNISILRINDSLIGLCATSLKHQSHIISLSLNQFPIQPFQFNQNKKQVEFTTFVEYCRTKGLYNKNKWEREKVRTLFKGQQHNPSQAWLSWSISSKLVQIVDRVLDLKERKYPIITLTKQHLYKSHYHEQWF